LVNILKYISYSMKVRLLRKDTIEDFANAHANGRNHFENFLFILKYADWVVPADIKRSYPGNLLSNGSDRVVFDVGGNGRNAFRVICKYAFGRKLIRLYVVWIGTHEEYNNLTPNYKLTVWKF